MVSFGLYTLFSFLKNMRLLELQLECIMTSGIYTYVCVYCSLNFIYQIFVIIQLVYFSFAQTTYTDKGPKVRKEKNIRHNNNKTQ